MSCWSISGSTGPGRYDSDVIHHCDITRAHWGLKSMADEMFVQQLVQVNAKVLHNWPVVKGIYGWPADFFTTGQLIPRHDVIMEMCYTGLCEFISLSNIYTTKYLEIHSLKYIHWKQKIEDRQFCSTLWKLHTNCCCLDLNFRKDTNIQEASASSSTPTPQERSLSKPMTPILKFLNWEYINESNDIMFNSTVKRWPRGWNIPVSDQLQYPNTFKALI